MKTIKHCYTNTTLFASDYPSLATCIDATVEAKTNLQYADLQGANLQYANLQGADLRYRVPTFGMPTRRVSTC